MSGLPVPDKRLLLRSERLVAQLCEIIARDGSLSFMAYMQEALYAPGLGYYVSGLRKFGEGGDFVTAPELSPLFAQCLAHQAQEVLMALGGGDVLEFGAGTGALAAGMLLRLDTLDCLPTRYLILELSPDLRQLQRQTLAAKAPHLLERVSWLDAWPTHFRGVALGNEILDAMPVERFRWRAGKVEQVRVSCAAGKLVESFASADAPLAAAVANIHTHDSDSWPEGFSAEINPLLPAWFSGFAQAAESAVLLLIDYGYPRDSYYHPMRAAGTLRCYYQHRAHDDPYLYPGLQDITAHVDFTAVAEAGTQAGMSLEGFISQQQFLFNCDLAVLVEAAMAQADDVRRLILSRQVQQLTLPGQMGEAFNVIGFSKNMPAILNGPLRGFALNDRTHRL